MSRPSADTPGGVIGAGGAYWAAIWPSSRFQIMVLLPWPTSRRPDTNWSHRTRLEGSADAASRRPEATSHSVRASSLVAPTTTVRPSPAKAAEEKVVGPDKRCNTRPAAASHRTNPSALMPEQSARVRESAEYTRSNGYDLRGCTTRFRSAPAGKSKTTTSYDFWLP